MTPEQLANFKASLAAKKGQTKSSPSVGEAPKSGKAVKDLTLIESMKAALNPIGPELSQALGLPALGAAAVGAIDTGSVGAAAPIMAATRELIPNLGARALSAIGMDMGGMEKQPLIDPIEEQAELDSIMADHPVASTVGQVAGAAMPGTLATKGLLKAGQAIPSLGAALTSKGLSGMLTRSMAASGTAATEGGIYAANKGEDVKKNAVISGVLGAAAQPAAETAGGVLRYLAGSKDQAKAMDALRRAPQVAAGVDQFPAQMLKDQRLKMGEEGSLVDMPVYNSVAESLMYSPDNIDNVRSLTRELNERVDKSMNPEGTVRAKFRARAAELLPKAFQRNGDIIDDARAEEVVMKEVRAQQVALQPQYEAILKRSDNVKLKPEYIKDAASTAFRADSPTEGGARMLKWIDKRLGELAAKKGFINPRDAQTLKVDIGTKIDQALTGDKPDRDTAAQLIAMKGFLQDKVLDPMPGYKEVNAQFKDEADFLKAYKMGRDVMNMKEDDLSTLPDKLAALDDSAHEGFLEGFARGMTNGLSDTPKTGRMINKVSDNQGFRSVIRMVMPDVGDKFLQEVDSALIRQNTAQKLVGNSATARRIAESGAKDARSKFNVAVILGAVMNKIMPGQGSSLAAGLGAAKQEFTHATYPPGMARHLATLLGQKGVAADRVLGELASGAKTSSVLPPPSIMDNVLNTDVNPAMLGSTVAAGVSASEQRKPTTVARRRRAVDRRRAARAAKE